MSYQMVFERHEIKYLLSETQVSSLQDAMKPYMTADTYGHTTIRNIYFDTDTYRLIRHSLEHPTYKEKLRVRSYAPAGPEDPVFVELKKKYRSVVYKRRLSLSQETAIDCILHRKPLPDPSQIASEIDYFCAYYQTLSPAVFLSYERDAYRALDGGDLRITVDQNILSRRTDFRLDSPLYGTPLLEPKTMLLEIKTSQGLPLWLTHWLTRNHLYKTSFSKYGAAYQRTIYSQDQGGILYA